MRVTPVHQAFSSPHPATAGLVILRASSQQPASQFRRHGAPPPFAIPTQGDASWALVSNHHLSPPWGDEREGPLRSLSPRKGTRVGNHPGLGTDGPLPSASDPAKGPTAISSQATQGKRTPSECWPQLAGLRASPFTPDPCSRGERICRANRAANRAKMSTEDGGGGSPKPMPLTLNYRWRGSNGYTQPWMEMLQTHE